MNQEKKTRLEATIKRIQECHSIYDVHKIFCDKHRNKQVCLACQHWVEDINKTYLELLSLEEEEERKEKEAEHEGR